MRAWGCGRVGIKLPTIEVRYEKLSVDADVLVGGRALPTLKNASLNFLQGALDSTGLVQSKKTTLNILHSISGIIKPARFVPGAMSTPECTE
jgi:hypothetical protein